MFQINKRKWVFTIFYWFQYPSIFGEIAIPLYFKKIIDILTRG